MQNSSPTEEQLATARAFLITAYALLSQSVMRLVFGRDNAAERALLILRYCWVRMPADPLVSFNIFVETTFTRAMFNWSSSPGPLRLLLNGTSSVFDAPIYRDLATANPWFYNVMDFAVTELQAEHVVPASFMFRPYPENPHRSADIMNRIDPLPLLFITTTGALGFSIEKRRAREIELLNGTDQLLFLNAQGNPRTTIKVKHAHWNYRLRHDGQIRGTDNKPLNSLNRLAFLTAGAVRKFMQSNEREVIDTSLPQRWNIGEGPGEIKIADVILLGVVFLSDGVLTPLLRVRTGFAFAPGAPVIQR